VREGEETKSVDYGASHERIEECIDDIDGTIRFLRARGYTSIHLIGHSTGANKICLYNARKPRNRVSSFILLGPGDDVGLCYAEVGGKRFREILVTARRKAKGRERREVALREGLPWPISWESFYDMIDPDGDYNVFPFLDAIDGLELSKEKELFSEFRTIRKPTLALFGSEDEYCFGQVELCAEMLRAYAPPRADVRVEIVQGANHGFHPVELETGRRIARWITEKQKAESRKQK
jgi:pimeloyl-ACP methyl ester carboxylesterase